MVVGAGGAVGSLVCNLLLEAGRPVVAADVSEAALGVLATPTGSRIGTQVLDACSSEQVDAWFAELRDRHGSLSGLVNAQGVAGRGLIDDVSPERWDLVLQVNLTSVFYCCRAALPLLQAGGGGVIVNLASVAGLRETPGSLAYATSKAGVVMLTRTLAADLARTGTRVHAVCPTAIDSPMVRANVPGETLVTYAEAQPMGRLLTTGEVARLTADLVLSPRPYTPEPLVV